MSIEWMDKDVLHIYNEILLSHKKEWSNSIGSNMDRTRDHHPRWSRSEKHKITNVEPKIGYKWTYLQSRLIDIENL